MNIGHVGWAADYPLRGRTTSHPSAAAKGIFNLARYCDPDIDKQIKSAYLQQPTNPGAAADAWATIDRELVNAAAVIPFGHTVRRDFVSRRVGDTLVHPMFGPLIAQMWVQ